jgi:hypothetical protein
MADQEPEMPVLALVDNLLSASGCVMTPKWGSCGGVFASCPGDPVAPHDRKIFENFGDADLYLKLSMRDSVINHGLDRSDIAIN